MLYVVGNIQLKIGNLFIYFYTGYRVYIFYYYFNPDG